MTIFSVRNEPIRVKSDFKMDKVSKPTINVGVNHDVNIMYTVTVSFSLPDAAVAFGEIRSDVREDDREEQDEPSLLRLSVATLSWAR